MDGHERLRIPRKQCSRDGGSNAPGAAGNFGRGGLPQVGGQATPLGGRGPLREAPVLAGAFHASVRGERCLAWPAGCSPPEARSFR